MFYRLIKWHLHLDLHSNEFGRWNSHSTNSNFDRLCHSSTVDPIRVSPRFLESLDNSSWAIVQRCLCLAVLIEPWLWQMDRQTKQTRQTQHHIIYNASIELDGKYCSMLTLYITNFTTQLRNLLPVPLMWYEDENKWVLLTHTAQH